MRYQAVVFDLDGTLLNTLEDLTDSVNAALRLHAMPQRSTEEIRQFVGNGIAKLLERAVPDRTPEELRKKVLEDFREYYGEHCRDKTEPYAGIMELLRTLKKAGIKMAVVSNKADFAVKELVPVYFGELIGVANGEKESEGIRKKPAPDMVRTALKKLGCSPKEAVYVGDSDVDIKTAQNCGMDCISVTWGFRSRAFLKQEGAEKIIDTPSEIMQYL